MNSSYTDGFHLDSALLQSLRRLGHVVYFQCQVPQAACLWTRRPWGRIRKRKQFDLVAITNLQI